MRNSLNKLCLLPNSNRLVNNVLGKQLVSQKSPADEASEYKEKIFQQRSQVKGINLLRNPSHYKVNILFFSNKQIIFMY